jgi:hypothetical protein
MQQAMSTVVLHSLHQQNVHGREVAVAVVLALGAVGVARHEAETKRGWTTGTAALVLP